LYFNNQYFKISSYEKINFQSSEQHQQSNSTKIQQKGFYKTQQISETHFRLSIQGFAEFIRLNHQTLKHKKSVQN